MDLHVCECMCVYVCNLIKQDTTYSGNIHFHWNFSLILHEKNYDKLEMNINMIKESIKIY